MNCESEEFYISLVGEAFDGYTESQISNKNIYFKHVTIRDQRYVHKYYEKYRKIAIERGLEAEEERVSYVIKEGIWSEEDDAKIASLENELESLKATAKATFLPSQKDLLLKDAEKRREELIALTADKKEIIGKTAEDYAAVRGGDELLRSLLFGNEALTKNLYTEDDFGDLETWEIAKIGEIYQGIGDKFADSVIQKAVLRPFFNMYLSSCENLADFYGKPVVDLTIYQLKVALYGRMFFNIFQNTMDIPEHIKDDPEKLMAFSDAQMNRDGRSGGGLKDDSDASAVFGATKEDMEQIRADQKAGKTVSLTEEAKKHGGKLNMEQMMRLAGHDV